MSARLLHSATALIALATLPACQSDYGDGYYTDARGDFDIENEDPVMPGAGREPLRDPSGIVVEEVFEIDGGRNARDWKAGEGGMPWEGVKPGGGGPGDGGIDPSDRPVMSDLHPWSSSHPWSDTFELHGWVSNLITSDETGAGLCVLAFDARDVREGGAEDARPLAHARVRNDYSYHLKEIPLTPSKAGLLIVVDECRTPAEGIAIRTGALLPRSTLDRVTPGEKLHNFEIFMIDDTARHLLQKALEGVGYEGIWYSEGALIGFVYGDGGMPIDNARVEAPDGLTTYYFTQDLRFRTKAGTDASEGAMFMIPGATQGTYTTWVDGEGHEQPILGSFMGGATVTTINTR